MAGLLELLARYVDEVGPDPIGDAAASVRSDTSRDREEREATASEMERIADVLGLRRGGR